MATVQAILHDLPKLDQVEDYHPYQVSRVLDSSGNLVAEFSVEKRSIISIRNLPEHVRDAFLAAEDASFYEHQGIDYFGIMRAVLNEIKYQFVGGQRMGGSTITQQTAKTMLLSRQRTYTRKIKEFILAKRIEDALTKDEILNLYLNQIYFGHGSYGIEEAAKTYYGISARDLTLGQATSLASVPKSPNRINPIRDPERVKQRRDYILDQMVTHGLIGESAARKAKDEPIVVRDQSHPYLNKAPYFVEEVRRFLVAQFGEEELYKAGLTIQTSLSMPLQMAASESLRWGLRAVDKRQGYRGPIARLLEEGAEELAKSIQEKKPSEITLQSIVLAVVRSVSDEKNEAVVELAADTNGTMPFRKMLWARPFNPDEYTPVPTKPSAVLKEGDIIRVRIDKVAPAIEVALEQKPLVNGAVVAINPENHRVVAMVGGYDFSDSKFNRATQARRQPGSSFKPLVYVTGINEGVVTPATMIDDSPKEYDEWKPRNYTREFLGMITVRRCLLSSVNICSISIMEQVGIGSVLDLAKRAGEITPETPMPRDLTLALGSGEVIPLLHVNAFTMFPGGGRVGKPTLIEKITDPEGRVLYEVQEDSRQVIKPQSAFVMTNMMQGLMAAPGIRRITGLTEPLAGKTGTTNEFRSAWFMGFSQDLVAGVYVGFDDNRSLGIKEYGARAALPVWARFMHKALKVVPAREFVQPEGIVWRVIDQQTGEIASSTQIYDPGVAPQRVDESEVRETQEGVEIKKPPPRPPVLEAFIEGTEPDAETFSW
ncbi:MAG: PBP1A family penicillin-binding protein [Deltaproteobacteria bacterium]|nr:PBP1A family penicillin-binding protein [Deltaproteobacteria bacterium]